MASALNLQNNLVSQIDECEFIENGPLQTDNEFYQEQPYMQYVLLNQRFATYSAVGSEGCPTVINHFQDCLGSGLKVDVATV